MIQVVRDNYLLNQVLVIYQEHSFSLRKRPNVHFEGEEGYDAGGLTRDFFSSTMKLVYASHNGFFEGVVPAQNMHLVLSGKFKAIGRFFAHSFIHGGPSLFHV